MISADRGAVADATNRSQIVPESIAAVGGRSSHPGVRDGRAGRGRTAESYRIAGISVLKLSNRGCGLFITERQLRNLRVPFWHRLCTEVCTAYAILW
jgi:hypothetical protein